MSLRLFVRRERISLVRGEGIFRDRRNAGLAVLLAVSACFVLHDRRGWDRSSIEGARGFAFSVLGFVTTSQTILAISLGLLGIGPTIASERERRTLDSLLTTRLSSAAVVLGVLAAGLARYVASLAALLPLAVALVFMGGIASELLILAVGGLIATWFVVSALSVAASVVASSKAVAVSYGVCLNFLWLFGPYVFLATRPRLWPGCPRQVVTIAYQLIQTSPTGLMSSLLGLLPLGNPIAVVARMIVREVAAGALVTGWAIWQLRPASRRIDDAQGHQAQLRVVRMVRAARWRRPRPACGEDPIFWNAIHSDRPALVERVTGGIVNAVLLGLLAVVLSWFVFPAFSELAVRGYGVAPEAFALPELNPFVRAFLNRLSVWNGRDPAPGQARLEFNMILRQFSALITLPYALGIVGIAADSLDREQRRGTWPGVLTTPLSGWEILRGKMLGTLWRTRSYDVTLLLLWALGLLTGALHPLGFVAGLATLAVWGAFCVGLGVAIPLAKQWGGNVRESSLEPASTLIGLSSSILVTLGPMASVWLALASYEDVHAMVLGGAFVQWGSIFSGRVPGARAVMTAWTVGMVVVACGTVWLMRASVLGFDAAVGRPCRSAAPESRLTEPPGAQTGTATA